MAEGLNTKVEIYGLKDAIKKLNSVEPGLRNQIAKDFRNVAKPVINDALALVPNTVPLSGMGRKWTQKKSRSSVDRSAMSAFSTSSTRARLAHSLIWQPTADSVQLSRRATACDQE